MSSTIDSKGDRSRWGGSFHPQWSPGTVEYLLDLLTVRARHGLEGRVTLFHGSGRSASGGAGEPPDTEGAGCPKLLNRLNGLLIVRGLPAQPKATTGCVALRIRHYELHSTDRTPEGAKVVY